MPYLPSGWVDKSGPINRFLPPVPEGAARAFVACLPPSSGWVLDPIGSSPHLSAEMARAGRRVLVTAGNPVSRFLLDLAAHPPKLSDLQATLADLAAARKEGKRLETHLQSLYVVRCENCRRELPAEAFLWDAKTGILTGYIYNCSCGSGGEVQATPQDRENAARWALTDGLHRTRVLERVAPGVDPDRPFAEEALGFYLPRAVYALGTIINRLDVLSNSDERRRCMIALLLYAADCTNSLWPHGTERPRPRQLIHPQVYRENNVWMALEAGVKFWASDEPSIPLTLWPDEPPESGGLCIFEGPLRELVPDLAGRSIQAVVIAIPRPNQAYWALSALWSGWLWGHAAVGPFKAVLRRRRYDWQWHAEALKALFGNMVEVITAEHTPVFGILSEAEASFVSAVFLAAQPAGLEISGMAYRGEMDPIQLLWKKSGPAIGKKNKKPLLLSVNFTKKVIREILTTNNGPMEYLHLHLSIMAALAKKGMLAWSDDALSNLVKNLHEALHSPEFLDLENRTNPETGRWTLAKLDRQESLLAF